MLLIVPPPIYTHNGLSNLETTATASSFLWPEADTMRRRHSALAHTTKVSLHTRTKTICVVLENKFKKKPVMTGYWTATIRRNDDGYTIICIFRKIHFFDERVEKRAADRLRYVVKN